MRKLVVATITTALTIGMSTAAFADDISVRTSIGSGEVVFTFSKNNELKIDGINEEKSPFRFQTSHYLCATIDGSNLNQGVKTGILLNEFSSTFYIIDFKDDKLFLYRNNNEIIDGEGYTFQRVQPEPNLNPHPSSRK